MAISRNAATALAYYLFSTARSRISKAGFGQLTNECAGDAASAFATCGHAVALALGSIGAAL
jgi:hypothetical protein